MLQGELLADEGLSSAEFGGNGGPSGATKPVNNTSCERASYHQYRNIPVDIGGAAGNAHHHAAVRTLATPDSRKSSARWEPPLFLLRRLQAAPCLAISRCGNLPFLMRCLPVELLGVNLSVAHTEAPIVDIDGDGRLFAQARQGRAIELQTNQKPLAAYNTMALLIIRENNDYLHARYVVLCCGCRV